MLICAEIVQWMPRIFSRVLQDPIMCSTLIHFSFLPLLKVHCISTEFTPRKHGGEKGVPFRIQIDTFKQNESGEYTEHLHSASCQIKVFKVMPHACKHPLNARKYLWCFVEDCRSESISPLCFIY